MSGEGRTNIRPVELLQDLAVMGTLGMDHIERNGHHYYHGLCFLPEDLQERVLAAHADLYRRHEAGFAAMKITDGRFQFGSVVDAPFGRDFELYLLRFTPSSSRMWNPRTSSGPRPDWLPTAEPLLFTRDKQLRIVFVPLLPNKVALLQN